MAKKERNGEMMWVVNGVREYRGNEEKKTKRGRGTQTLGCMVGVVRIVGLACSDEDFNGRREERKWEMPWVVNGVRGYKGNEEKKRKRERKRVSGVSEMGENRGFFRKMDGGDEVLR